MWCVVIRWLWVLLCIVVYFFFSSRRRHTRCALVTGVQTCALPIYQSRIRKMAGADRHIVILADENDYSVVEIQCRDQLRILFDKVADEWRNNALAEGNGARHIHRAARRPLTVAQRESLNTVFDHVSAEIGRAHV